MSYDYNWPIAFKEAFGGKRHLLDEHCNEVYHTVLLPFIRTKASSESDAKDICSTVIARFWKKFYVNKDMLPENVNGYMVTMSKNALYQFYNTINKKKEWVSLLESNDLVKVAKEDSLDVLELFGESEEERMYRAFGRAFSSMGEKCKQLLRMNVIEGKRIKEISSILGFPTPNAATQKKVNCLKKLRKLTYLEINHQNR